MSAKGDWCGSTIRRLLLLCDGDPGWLEPDEGPGDVFPEFPNGLHLRRLVGRWFIASQSKDRFKVAHAIVKYHVQQRYPL